MKIYLQTLTSGFKSNIQIFLFSIGSDSVLFVCSLTRARLRDLDKFFSLQVDELVVSDVEQVEDDEKQSSFGLAGFLITETFFFLASDFNCCCFFKFSAVNFKIRFAGTHSSQLKKIKI